jgi:hypothetical protein
MVVKDARCPVRVSRCWARRCKWGIEPRRAAPARNPSKGCESAFKAAARAFGVRHLSLSSGGRDYQLSVMFLAG